MLSSDSFKGSARSINEALEVAASPGAMWLQHLIGSDDTVVAASPAAPTASVPAPFFFPLAVVFDFICGDAAAAGAAFNTALSLRRAREPPPSPSLMRHRALPRGTPGHPAFNGHRGIKVGGNSRQSSVDAVSETDDKDRDDFRDASLSENSSGSEESSSEEDDDDITEVTIPEGPSELEIDINLRARALLTHDISQPLPLIEYPADYRDDNMQTPPETVPESGAQGASCQNRER